MAADDLIWDQLFKRGKGISRQDVEEVDEMIVLPHACRGRGDAVCEAELQAGDECIRFFVESRAAHTMAQKSLPVINVAPETGK